MPQRPDHLTKETIVLDTSVFVRILAGHDTEGRVYSKIIRDCNRVAVDDAVIFEYKDTLKRKFVGLEEYFVARKLNELEAYHKLVKVAGDSRPPDDIDPEDRHLVRACKEAKAKYLITTDDHHLWNHRDHIKNTHRVEVLRPQEYLDMTA
jgi:predicted nucleic acid-binding protein